MRIVTSQLRVTHRRYGTCSHHTRINLGRRSAMSKSLLIIVAIAVVAFAVPTAAQTNDEESQQRPSESVPVCVPTTGMQETTTPLRTLTFYNPVTASSTPSLTFYNPVAYPRPALTYYTPLGQIDPPIRTQQPPSLPPVETVQSAPPTLSQPSMPPTTTIPAPGVCPPGAQVERVAR